MYSVPASFRRPVAPMDVTRPVSRAYRARALFRSPLDEPGKFAAENMPASSAGSCAAMPKPMLGTVFQLSAQSSRRVKLPPNDMLCDPFSQLNVSSMEYGIVLRCDGPAAAPGCAAVRSKPGVTAKPPWFANMSAVALSKNPSGDDCQPPRISLTLDADSVERSVIDPD